MKSRQRWRVSIGWGREWLTKNLMMEICIWSLSCGGGTLEGKHWVGHGVTYQKQDLVHFLDIQIKWACQNCPVCWCSGCQWSLVSKVDQGYKSPISTIQWAEWKLFLAFTWSWMSPCLSVRLLKVFHAKWDRISITTPVHCMRVMSQNTRSCL